MFQSIFKSNPSQVQMRIDGTDKEFDRIYPRNIQRLSDQHFTPLEIAKKAAAFLVRGAGTRVLDIGSGAGKFCFAGASSTTGNFVGIEQREDLVTLSNALATEHNINNVRFIHTNVMGIDFGDFDAFYLFNPFYENVRSGQRMDNAVLVSPSLFASYSAYTKNQLDIMPERTRLATYYTSRSMVPESYTLIETSDNGHLLLWEKRSL
ncbi:MAG: methyltransferase domain-containing protein [Chryseolinea sp.]